jgi:hypothetical protein
MEMTAYVIGLFIRDEVAMLSGRCRHNPCMYAYGYMGLRFVLHHLWRFGHGNECRRHDKETSFDGMRDTDIPHSLYRRCIRRDTLTVLYQ